MLNQAQIIGHLGADPEIRVTTMGIHVASFSVATSEKWKDKNTGEIKEATEWHRVTVFGSGEGPGLVEVVEKYLKKGSRCFIQGRLKTNAWTDDNQIKRWSTEIQVPKIGGKLILLGDAQGADRPPVPPKTNTDIDDEVPF